MRLGFVTGTTPDKWARAWREQRRGSLELVPVTEPEQEQVLLDGAVDMCLVRLPLQHDGLHVVRLYDELAVAVASREHFIAAADDAVTLADLEGERPDWPPMSYEETVETVAAGTGVAVMPMSIARLYGRKDVVHRVVSDQLPTTIALAWLVERDDDDTQSFVGVVRGRTARSSR